MDIVILRYITRLLEKSQVIFEPCLCVCMQPTSRPGYLYYRIPGTHNMRHAAPIIKFNVRQSVPIKTFKHDLSKSA